MELLGELRRQLSFNIPFGDLELEVFGRSSLKGL